MTRLFTILILGCISVVLELPAAWLAIVALIWLLCRLRGLFVPLFFLMLLAGQTCRSADVTLAWEYSPDQSQITTYLLYWREASVPGYTNFVNAGDTNIVTVSNLLDDANFCFVAVAVGTNGLVSPYSNEVEWFNAPPLVGLPTLLTPYVQVYWPQTFQQSTDLIHWQTVIITNHAARSADKAAEFFRIPGVTNAQIHLSPAP